MFKVKKAGVYINQEGGRQRKQTPESEKEYKKIYKENKTEE